MTVPARRLALGLGALALAVSACAPAATVEFQTVVPSEESRATISALPSGAKRVDPAQRITVTKDAIRTTLTSTVHTATFIGVLVS